MNKDLTRGDELGGAIHGAMERNRAQRSVMDGLPSTAEGHHPPTDPETKLPAKRSLVVRLLRLARRSPGVGAALGACIGFAALQGATYLQDRWKGNAAIVSTESEKELIEWLRRSGNFALPTSAKEAKKLVSLLEFELLRYKSPGVRTRVIEMTEFFRKKQIEYELAEAQAAKAAEAFALAEEQKRLAKLAVQQAADAQAAEIAQKAAIAAEQAAQEAAQEAREAEQQRAVIRDQIRMDRQFRLGVF